MSSSPEPDRTPRPRRSNRSKRKRRVLYIGSVTVLCILFAFALYWRLTRGDTPLPVWSQIGSFAFGASALILAHLATSDRH